MKYRTGNEIRQLFLDFFKTKGHRIEPSASLVPVDDPTLLWINSGVAALKKYFDGSVIPTNPRITNSQKAIRTNDIENVGKTARHHTFFEMLGNFSIGDYFKEEAISFAWEFLTSEDWIGFEKEKLYITVHPEDVVAYTYWTEKIGIKESHIHKTYDNFWQIGEGPCGPNSEIFYDRGEEFDKENVGIKLFHDDIENDRYIEVWNLVFSQYNAQEGIKRESYAELPHKNIDTGMGLERLVAIVQNAKTNFDTDLFMPIINATSKKANVKYEEYEMAYKVIADHIRTITFALADGAMFANEGRGYVLRRLLRRGSRFGLKIGIKEPFMFELVETVIQNMKSFYPYLIEKTTYIAQLVKREEDKFMLTLNEGEHILNNMIVNGELSGKDAFKLYDTYGFPFELTQEICDEKGIILDKKEFDSEMEEQKNRARNARKDIDSMKSQSKDLMEFSKESIFEYTPSRLKSTIIGLFQDGVSIEKASNQAQIILDKTVFYAESGGQVADSGKLYLDNRVLDVVNVIKAPNGQHLHFVEFDGEIELNQKVVCEINIEKRLQTQANHTATHLLQQALKDVLGDHVSQAGSYVSDKYGRFDFNHFQKLTKEELVKIETLVNQKIFQQLPVEIEEMDIDTAKKKGARAFFNEKYGEYVRVVSAGDYSMELCGGTHVSSTGMIGLFKILVETSVGSGIRRIESVTGIEAFNYTLKQENQLNQIAEKLKLTSTHDLNEKIDHLINDYTNVKKENEQLQIQILKSKASELLNNIEVINNINVLVHKTVNVGAKELKETAIELRNKIKTGIVLVINTDEKLSFVLAITDDLVKQGFKAGDIVKEISAMVDGRGGGKPDLAQGGSNDVAKVANIIELLKSKII